MSMPAATPATSDAETFEEMVFALAHHDAPTVAFVECGSLAKRNELETQLAERLPEYKFYTIDVTPFPVVSLLHTLNEQLPEAVRTAPPVTYLVHVHGLENSLLVSHDGRIEPSRMTAQLNLERELLFRNVPYIIVLWGDAHFFRTLHREAPDLCHWVTYHFRFADPAAQPSHALPPLPPERLPQKGNIAERQQRIAELTERYERLQLEDSDKKRLLRDKVAILSLLAQEQAECFEFGRALDTYQIAIALQETLHDDDEMLGELWFNKAGVELSLRRFLLALDSYKKVMDLGQIFNRGATYHQIGMVYAEQRQWGAALENYNQALEWHQRIGDEIHQGGTYHQIGIVYAEQRQWGAALENYNQALEWNQRMGNELELGGTYHQIGRVYEEQRQWRAALENYDQAIEWKKRISNEFEMGSTYHQIGRVYEEQEQWEAALKSYDQALEWNKRMGDDFAMGSTYHQIGIIHAKQRQWKAALENYNLALEWKQRMGNEPELGSTYHQIGRVHEEEDRRADAVGWFTKAIANLMQYDHPGLPIAQASLARVQAKLQQAPE